MRKSLASLFIFIILFNFTYANYQDQSSNQSYHPLYLERKNKLIGAYAMVSRIGADSVLTMQGLEAQNHSLKETPVGFGIQFGHLFSKNHRITFNYEQFLRQHGFSHQLFTIGYSITPLIPNTQNLRLLLGINAGVALAKFSSGSFNVNDNPMGKLNYIGLTYGVKGGLIHETSAGEIEFGIQSRRIQLGEQSSELIINNTPTKTTLNLDDTSSTNMFLGYNLLF